MAKVSVGTGAPSERAQPILNHICYSVDGQKVQTLLFHLITIFDVQSKQLNGCDEGIHLLISFKKLFNGAINSLIILSNMTEIKFNGDVVEKMTADFIRNNIKKEGIFECTYVCPEDK